MDAFHRDLQKIRIGSIGVVDVNFAIWRAVEPSELLRKVCLGCLNVLVSTAVVGELVPDWLVNELFLEEIHLVEEKDNGRLAEPW